MHIAHLITGFLQEQSKPKEKGDQQMYTTIKAQTHNAQHSGSKVLPFKAREWVFLCTERVFALISPHSVRSNNLELESFYH